jgi:hypothetical protein
MNERKHYRRRENDIKMDFKNSVRECKLDLCGLI